MSTVANACRWGSGQAPNRRCSTPPRPRRQVKSVRSQPTRHPTTRALGARAQAAADPVGRRLLAGGGLPEPGGAVDGVLVELGNDVLAEQPDRLQLLFH